MSQQLVEVDKQPKRTIVLGKDWFHAIKPDPILCKDSSMPGIGEERKSSFRSLLYNPKTDGRCCVGIYLSACGVKDNKLADCQIAVQVDKIPEEAQWLLLEKNNEVSDVDLLYGVNDGDTEIGVLNKFYLKKTSKTF